MDPGPLRAFSLSIFAAAPEIVGSASCAEIGRGNIVPRRRAGSPRRRFSVKYFTVLDCGCLDTHRDALGIAVVAFRRKRGCSSDEARFESGVGVSHFNWPWCCGFTSRAHRSMSCGSASMRTRPAKRVVRSRRLRASDRPPPTGPNLPPIQPLLDIMSLTGRKKGL